MRTNAEKERMTQKKSNSTSDKERMVMDELLKMGFSYGIIGTHYLHDSILFAVSTNLGSACARDFCKAVRMKACEKYGVTYHHLCTYISISIEQAFRLGNIEYILNVLKESYDHEGMRIQSGQLIMILRTKILSELNEEQQISDLQLKYNICDAIENITDRPLLEAIYNITISLGRATAL